MKEDPRHKNQKLDTVTPAALLESFSAELQRALSAIDRENLEQFCDLVLECASNDQMAFICGNGGSASIATHAACDLNKGTFISKEKRLRTTSLSANEALATAVSNDFGFETIFEFQLRSLASSDDLLIAISSSGNSENIMNAVLTAKDLGLKTVSISGFDGGLVSKTADVPLVIPAHHYGVVEDVSMNLLHIVTTYVYDRLASKE